MPFSLTSHDAACEMQHAAILSELDDLRTSVPHRPSYQAGISAAIEIAESTPASRVASLQPTFWNLSELVGSRWTQNIDGLPAEEEDHRQALVDAWALAGDVVSGHRCEIVG